MRFPNSLRSARARCLPGGLFFAFALTSLAAAISVVAVAAENSPGTDTPVQLSAVVVQDSAMTPSTAIDQQHQSTPVVTVMSGQAIDESPAKFIGDAIERIPGVSTHRDYGEVTFVRIRGLDQNLSNTTFNGLRLLPGGTNNGGGIDNAGGVSSGASQRAVNFGILPTNLAENIEVTKTVTPDQDAEAIGGNLNLTPRSALTYHGRFTEIGLSGGYQFQSRRPTDQLRFALADTFQTSSDVALGVYVSGNHFENSRSIDLVATVPTLLGLKSNSAFLNYPSTSRNSLTFRRYGDKQRVYGATANLDFKVGAHAHYFANFYVTGFDELNDREQFSYSGLDSNKTDAVGEFIAPAASVGKTLRETVSKPNTYNAVAGGDYRLGRLKLDYRAGYSGFRETDSIITPSFALSATVPVVYDGYAEFPSATPTGGVNVADAANYKLSKDAYTGVSTTDKQFSELVDLKLHLSTADRPADLKFGESASFRRKTYGQQTANYTLSSTPLLSQFATNSGVADYNQKAYLGHYDLGPDVDYPALSAWLNAGGGTLKPVDNLLADFTGNENLLAVYGMYTVRADRLTLLTGVRVEFTDEHFAAFQQIKPPSGPTVLGPVAATRTYHDAFPTVQLKYDLRPTLVARFAYSTAIARPTFDQIVPYQNVTDNGTTVTINAGNPSLKPAYANDFDAAIEWYPASGSMLAADVFDKEISDYTVPVFDFEAATGSQTQTYANVAKARIYGAEASFRQKFTQLPGLLSGLGVQANGILSRSQARVHGVNSPASRLPQSSELTYNLGLFYERNGLSANVNVNFTGNFLEQINSAHPEYDIYTAGATYVSAGVAYRIDKHVSLFVKAANLSNQPRVRLYGNRQWDIYDSQYFGPSADGGVKINF